jgi:threonine synthase
VAVQAERCAPLARAVRAAAPAPPGQHGLGQHPPDEQAQGEQGPGQQSPGESALQTAAEGIAIAEPPRLDQMRELVTESGGTVITATEEGISSARLALAAQGIDIEPTAATTYAAWRETPGAPMPGLVVLAMTGAGLKSPPGPARLP